MARIKLNLPTGVVEEKSLLTAFKVDDNSYIIFDAESVGSMGLPIILVCKYYSDRVNKITDADEWTRVKGHLKEIISGVAKEYISIPNSLNVDEVYYTQLTLPVASFDVLKSSYDPKIEEKVDISYDSIGKIAKEMDSDVQSLENSNETLQMSENLEVKLQNDNELSAIANPILGDNINLSQSPIHNDILTNETIKSEADNVSSVNFENNLIEEPSLMGDLNQNTENLTLVSDENSDNASVVSFDENGKLDEKKVNPKEISNNISSTDIGQNSNTNDYSSDKDAFLAACSNMFDALVSKFEAKNQGNNN